MAARHGLGKLGKKIFDHQNPRIVIARGTDLEVIILHEFNKVATLDVLEMEPNIPWSVTHLLARKTMAFLDPRHNLEDPLVSHTIIRTEQDLMLVELGHDSHARPFVQGALRGGYLAHYTSFWLINNTSFFWL